jgi:hypothetical protein
LVVGSNDISEEPEDGYATDEDFDSQEESSTSSCPFCGCSETDCEHYLGSRDLHFCDDFTVLDTGPLAEHGELFGELAEAIAVFLQAGMRSRIASLKPKRLRDLVQAVADGNSNYFTELVKRVRKDTKVPVVTTSFEDNGGPDFCSIVEDYWAKDVPAILAGMWNRTTEDIRRLTEAASA